MNRSELHCWDCRRMTFEGGQKGWHSEDTWPELKCTKEHWCLIRSNPWGDDAPTHEISECMRMAKRCPDFFPLSGIEDLVDIQAYHIWIQNDEGVAERAEDFCFMQDPVTGTAIGMDGEQYRVVMVAPVTRKVVLQKI